MIGQKSYVLLISSLLSALLNFIGLWFITNKLGPDIYGEFVFLMATVASFNFLADLGFDSTHMKRVAEGQPIDVCFGTYLKIKMILTGITIVLQISLLSIWMLMAGKDWTSAQIWALALFIGYYAIISMSTVIALTFYGKGDAVKYGMIIIVEPCFRVPVVIFLSLVGATVVQLASVSFLASITMLCIGIFFIYKSGIRIGKTSIYRYYLVFAIPMSVTSIIGIISQYFDKMLIGTFYPLSDVAFYATVFVIISVVTMISGAISGVTFPAFSQIFSEGRKDEIKALTLNAEFYIAMITLPMLAILMIFPNQVITTFFGNRFAGNGLVLQLTCISSFIAMINGVYFNQISACNHPKTVAKLFILSFIISMSLLIILVPPQLFGITLGGLSIVGACYASLISGFITFLATRFSSKAISNTFFNPNILIVIVMAFCSGAAAYLLNTILNLSGLLGLIFVAFLVFSIYFVLILSFKLIKKDELNYILHILNPVELWSYIKLEFRK